MFKFLKGLLPKEERKVFDITVKPFIIYSVVNIIFIFLAMNHIGILNEDVAYGLFISWIIYTFIFMFSAIRT